MSKQQIQNFVSSKQLERHVLSGLIKYPEIFAEVDRFLDEKCFVAKVNGVIFSIVKSIIISGGKPDSVLIAQKIKNLGISFEEDINIFDYLQNLSLAFIQQDSVMEAIKDLVKTKVRNDICVAAKEVKDFVVDNGNLSLDEIASASEKIFYEGTRSKFKTQDRFLNVFEGISDYIEDIGNTPPDESKFLYGPFETINRIYGPLLEPSNVTVVGARTAVGKSALSTYYTTWVAEKHNIPILYLDFGEMTYDQIRIRAACMRSKGRVSPYHLKRGLWRSNQELMDIIREELPKSENIRMFYENIGRLSPNEVLSAIRSFYYTKVKPYAEDGDDRFIVNYDYIKPFETKYGDNTPEWKQMGHFVQDVKTLITEEIPSCCFWGSLQLNRSGITKGKTEVDDSENSFSISDRIVQQTSFSFIFRDKMDLELAKERQQYGESIFLPVKMRDLISEDAMDALKKVEVEKGQLKSNYINIKKYPFYFEERGDLKTMTSEINSKLKVEKLKEKKEDSSDGELL